MSFRSAGSLSSFSRVKSRQQGGETILRRPDGGLCGKMGVAVADSDA